MSARRVGFLERFGDGFAVEFSPVGAGKSFERLALYRARCALADCCYDPAKAALWAEVDYWEYRLRLKPL